MISCKNHSYFGGMVIAAVALMSPFFIEASMIQMETLELDFSKPSEVKEKAMWSNPERLNLTADGLGFDQEPAGSVELNLETRELVAIGVSWRPAQNARINVKINPPKKSSVPPNGQTAYPRAGDFFVRYSPDAKHWSTWQRLEPLAAEKGEPAQWSYRGEIMISRRARAAYEELLQTYMRTDVPWGSDEEAAVKWILKKDPRFFENNLPFIGYLQFLLETKLNGGQRIRSVHINAISAVGGTSMVPKDGKFKSDGGGPWRFKSE